MMPPCLPNTALLCESLLAAKEREDKNGKLLTQLFIWIKTTGKKKRRRSHLCNPIFFLSDVKSNHHLDNSPSVSAPAYSSPIASWEGGWEQLLQPLPQVSHVDLSELFSLDVSFFYTRSWELNQGLVLVCLCVVCVPGVGRSQRDS